MIDDFINYKVGGNGYRTTQFYNDQSNQPSFFKRKKKKKKLNAPIILIKMKHHCGELEISWIYWLPTGSQAANRKIRIQEEAHTHNSPH